MNIHPRAKLGPAARYELCQAIAAGASMRSAARAFSVAPATAHKWWHRFCSGEGLRDRLIKLRKPHGFFDATMLLVLEWDDVTRDLAPLQDVTEKLTASRCFEDLIDALLDRTPVGVHQGVRELRRGESIGVLPEALADVSPDEAAAHDAD